MLSKLLTTVAAVAAFILFTACSDTEADKSDGRATQSTTIVAGLTFIEAPAALLEQCADVATQVGYPVPCPTRIPLGLTPSGSTSECRLEIITAGGLGGCSRSWRGWVIGSSGAGPQHLVIQASPAIVRDFARAIDGPGWYSGARVRPLGRLRVDGRAIRTIYVPPQTNEGSAFAGHHVFLWSESGHTYMIGFHDLGGRQQTNALNIALVRAIHLIPPS
jgi:hypothetical protein